MTKSLETLLPLGASDFRSPEAYATYRNGIASLIEMQFRQACHANSSVDSNTEIPSDSPRRGGKSKIRKNVRN
jgi:hypothetical protein